jgi:hypothetical protein
MEKIDTKETSATQKKKMNYYLFQCISLHPDQRQEGGQMPTEGCGKYCIKGSKKTLRYIARKETELGSDEWVNYETILQGRCTNHPENESNERKQRLNEDYLNIRTYSTRKDAQNAVDTLNGVKQPPQPKGEPQGLSQRKIVVPAPLGQTSDEPEPFWDEDELKHSGLI